jgi:hypothetical protein
MLVPKMRILRWYAAAMVLVVVIITVSPEPVAVALFDIVTEVELPRVVIVVPAGMPYPTTKAPTSAGWKFA